MALCFVHGAAGYLGYAVARRQGPPRPALLLAAVALANAPDFDFLPGLLLGTPGVFHRGVSHTLLAAVVVGVVVGVVARWRRCAAGPALRAGVWAGAVYGSHLLVDCVTTDAKAPHGVRILWPLSDAHWIAPVTLFNEIIIDPSGRSAFLASLVTTPALRVWAGELGLVVLVLAAVRIGRTLWAGLAPSGAEVADEP